MMSMLQTELERMGCRFDRIEPIRSKDGVHVARVYTGSGTAVLKAFEKPEYRREIENYRILRSLGIRTLQIYAETDCALLMEDAAASPVLRLGAENDLAAPALAVRIAEWYRELHEKGRAWVAQNGQHLYDETDCITPENLALVREKTDTAGLPVWREIDRRFDRLQGIIASLPRTLTYNDFYWTNLIAARDGSFAFMYDYNLLGKGYVYGDVRNVISSMQDQAADAFLRAYGPTDPLERAADDVVGTLSTLVTACARPVFPKWAQGCLDALHSDLPMHLQRLFELA